MDFQIANIFYTKNSRELITVDFRTARIYGVLVKVGNLKKVMDTERVVDLDLARPD